MSQLLIDAGLRTWPLLWQFVLPVYAIGLLLERICPAQPRQPWRHVGFNLWWTVLFLYLTQLLVPPLMALTQPWIVAAGGGWLKVSLGDSLPEQIARGLLFFLVYDFFYYWWHRAQHGRLLWPQHKLHHAEQSINVTTGNRHHWLEEPIRVFAILLPMGVVASIPPPTIVWLWTIFMLWGYFVHLNVRLNLGWLTPVFAGPQYHRLHHSFQPEHIDRNFAAFFPLWDIVFGTYVAPKKNEYPPTGLSDGETLNHWWTSSASPFRDWLRFLKPSGPQRTSS
jgi:sterol desaturase/sphingolipid hydroxylase (fatty acid hydroxylase superfamily)